MATVAIPALEQAKLPDRGAVGVLCFILAESALFTIFVVAYLFYAGKSLNPPYPRDILEYPIWATICLLSSSGTIVAAEHALDHGRLAQFKIWWVVTILLGAEFLRQTGLEWYDFIVNKHFTVATNLFGTTFYTLVGLHASHVTVGLVFLLIVMAVTFGGFPIATQARRVRFLSWYWHFVDAIWVVVFTVVYVIGR
jgi:cytochrome c oxidase subunit III